MRIDTPGTVGAALGTELESLVARATADTGRPALSDHLALDLATSIGADGEVADPPLLVLGRDDHGALIAFSQASFVAAGRALEIVVDPTMPDAARTVERELLGEAFERIGGLGGGHVDWWIDRPTDEHDAAAAGAGMTRSRTLLEMRRPLPLDPDERTHLRTRTFSVGVDDAEWLRVNARAFAGHGEQSGWTQETLDQRLAEEWFDPNDFRVHDRDGRIAGFCWTKVHPATADGPALGEIYVIAVDPDFHGLGLGRALTLAGLEHLESAGLETAMLWVDAANDAAVALYRRLGFELHATKAAYSIDIPATADPRSDRA